MEYVDTAFSVDNFNTISIALDSRETDNHFNGQVISGIIPSIKDPVGKELLLIVLNPPTLVIPALPTNSTNMVQNSNNNNNTQQ